MSAAAHRHVRLRSVALWCATTAAVAGLASVVLPTLAASPRLVDRSPAFPDLLVSGCGAASLLAAGWLWAITTEVVVRVLAAGDRVAVRRPGPVRMAVLAACGAVVLSTAAAPASADERRPAVPHSLAGLPLPDRATGAGPVPDRAGTEAPTTVRVRPGDSLWAIAERRLGPGASAAALVGYWHRTYDVNAGVIGPDPDLIVPGQRLELPPTG